MTDFGEGVSPNPYETRGHHTVDNSRLLTAGVDDALRHYQEDADTLGAVTLCSFDGGSETIQRTEVHPDRFVTGAPSKGRKGLLGRLRRRGGSSVQYNIETTTGDKRQRLKVITGKHDIIAGSETLQTPQGAVTTQLHPGLNLEEAVDHATHLIQDGFPLSEERATAEKQDKPCDTIYGNEAVAMQKVVEQILSNAGGIVNLGNKNAPQEDLIFDVRNPTVDGQWSVSGVEVHKRAGTVLPGIPGLQGRSVLSFITFSSETVNNLDGEPFEGSLTVSIEGVYEQGTNKLLGAKVSYSDRSASKPTPLQIAPSDRQEISTAISNQVVSENLKGYDQ